jgi:carbon monoxide dehydrogenase subunit G
MSALSPAGGMTRSVSCQPDVTERDIRSTIIIQRSDHMPTIHLEITIDAPSATVWDAVRDVGALHTRLVPGFVAATEMLADAATPTRRVTFVNGVSADEKIVSIDEERRRLVWSIVGVEHHNGAMQVFDDADGTRVTWTADLLPAALVERFSPMMAMGLAKMKGYFEGTPHDSQNS